MGNVSADMEIYEHFVYPVCIVNAKNDLKIVSANQAFYDLINFTPSEIKLEFSNSIIRLFDSSAIERINEFLFLNKGQKHLSLEHEVLGKKENKWVLNEVSQLEVDGAILVMAFTDITFYRNELFAFSDLKKKEKFIMDSLYYDTFEFDPESDILYISNVKFLQQIYQVEKVNINDLFKDHVFHDESAGLLAEYIQKLKMGEKYVYFEFRARHEDGTYHWFKIYATKIALNEKDVIFGVIEDINNEKEMIFKYLNEAQYFQSFVSRQYAYGQVDVSENKVIKFGGNWEVYNEIINKMSYNSLFQDFAKKVVHSEDRIGYENIADMNNLKASYHNGMRYLEYDFRRIVEQNKMVWLRFHIHLFKNPINSHLMALLYLEDINESKRKELTSSYELIYKQLSNIYKKSSIGKSITEYLKDMPDTTLCVFIILNLESYNALEKDGSDQFVKSITPLLGDWFRKYDIIAPLQENEYALFLKDVADHDEFERRMNDFISRLKAFDDGLTFNMGITYAHKGQSYDLIYRQASLALVAAKEKGDYHYTYYQIDDPEIQNIAKLEKSMRKFDAFSDLQGDLKSSDNQELNDFVGEYGDMAYLIHPETYDLLAANKAFYNRIGKMELECLNMKCYEAVHGRSTPCPFCAKANWRNNRFYMYRNYNEKLEQEFLVKNKLIQWNDSQVVLAIAVDLSNDKNIIDSLENSTTENSYVLSGIQHLQMADTLHDSIINALENIGEFFRADHVLCWKFNSDKNDYEIVYDWSLEAVEKGRRYSGFDVTLIQSWQRMNTFTESINIDSPDVMLSESYDMYDLMQKYEIHNQRWIPYNLGEDKYLFSVDNITINFINASFMEAFMPFILSEWKNRELLDNIMYDTYHDKLTKVYNRVRYENDVVSINSDDCDSIGIIVANINNFKRINNSRGFEFGNYCLIEFAKMLSDNFNESTVYRLSGDEFLILSEDKSLKELENKIIQLKEKLATHEILKAAIGYAWDDVEKDVSKLTEEATNTMKANKKIFSDADQYNQDNERLTILNGLLNAIDSKNFKVFLQGKYDNEKDEFVGAEALVRYEDEEHGVIPPGKFIELLEKNRMIRYVDLFVFDVVCKYLEKWKKGNFSRIVISFNLSRFTLMENDIVETLESIFSKYDIDKDDIEVEITENDTEIGKAMLFQNARKLHDAGYKISLDDFGTKHTNLNILSDIYVDVLKIDKSLAHSLSKYRKKQTILKNIIRMCNELNISVIAEGVETKEQEDMLKILNCHLIQGYLYSKPIPIDEFEQKYLILKKPMS